MLQRLEMVGVGPASQLALDFAPRVNLLTGDNGLGKSFVLETAWWLLTNSIAGEPILPSEDGGNPSVHCTMGPARGSLRRGKGIEFDRTSWVWSRASLPSADLVLYARASGSIAVWDPGRSIPSSRGAESYGRLPYHFDRQSLWYGLSAQGITRSSGLIRDWVSWQQRGSDEFHALVSAIEGLSPTGETIRPTAPVRLSPADALDYPAIQLSTGVVPVTHTSAGMQRVLSLAYALVWTVYEHQRAATLLKRSPANELVLMVDEIEAHLHPRWQRVILPALLRVVKALAPSMQVQLIVSTHSPLVLASMEGEFDEAQDALFDFDLAPREGEDARADVEVRKLEWRARGDANQWLTSEVFDLKQPGSLRREQALERAKAALRQPGLAPEEVREIHHELHAVLGDTDPFWARWEARAKAAGIDP